MKFTKEEIEVIFAALMMADQTIREKKEHPDTPKEQIAEIKEDHKKVRDLFLRVLLHLDKPC